MGEHYTLQKGCFYLFTFYLFTFLVIIQLYSFTISSTGPFSISEWGVPFFIDSFFGWILIQKTSIIATLMLYRCIF